jgi:acetaldehyde dehydrogenase (acetylating)
VGLEAEETPHGGEGEEAATGQDGAGAGAGGQKKGMRRCELIIVYTAAEPPVSLLRAVFGFIGDASSQVAAAGAGKKVRARRTSLSVCARSHIDYC